MQRPEAGVVGGGTPSAVAHSRLKTFGLRVRPAALPLPPSRPPSHAGGSHLASSFTVPLHSRSSLAVQHHASSSTRPGRRRQPGVIVAATVGAGAGRAPAPPPTSLLARLVLMMRRVERALHVAAKTVRTLTDTPLMRSIGRWVQFAASMLFVVLYVYATYHPPEPYSLRHKLDLLLCIFFAAEYMQRLSTEESKLRMVTSFWNVCDLLAFAPPLLEAALRQWGLSLLGGLDLRWFKILRSMRVMRIGLLASELRGLHLSTRRGSWLNAGANFRLFQLFASIFILLFTTSSVIQIVERMPFHQAFYLVITTLTTVGFGDVVASTALGKAVVLAMICMGVVLIPVQATQFYTELMARRMVLGSLPDWRTPMVLLSTRLTEVRAFSDFYAEFCQSLASSTELARNTRMVVLCNRPSFEFRAFQELHERRITLVEGSAVSGQDLVSARAEKAQACMLLADRFTTDPEQEDLSILFQVWACKSFTKTVPLYVQTVRQSTVDQIRPFLDPGQDVVVSMEQTRFRLLALSAVCPGASTLIGNLVKSSAIRPPEQQEATLASRRWLRQYVNGCAFTFEEAPVLKHLSGHSFLEVAQWLFAHANFVLIGVIDHEERLLVNPSDLTLELGQRLLAVAKGKKPLLKALKAPFTPMPEAERQRLRSELEDSEAAPRRKKLPRGANAEGCVPLLVGNPDSESMDDDMVPCVPAAIAHALQSPEQVQAFVEEYRHNSAALEQQHESGQVQPRTAQAVAKAAAEHLADTQGGSSGCPIDWGARGLGGWSASGSLSSGSSDGEDGATGGNELTGHFIICGAEESFCAFLRYLRRCGAAGATVVFLHPTQPHDVLCNGNGGNGGSAGNGAGINIGAGSQEQQQTGPVLWVQGSPAEAASLRAAGASKARALVYLARSARPVKSAQAIGATVSEERGTREAVLADASALLACYGVGEESGSELTHAVVELLFTTSIEFLQPGLLLQGVSLMYGDDSSAKGVPRKSWMMRAWQQREAVAEGLAEWQANPYYVAGRVSVPALHDTFAVSCFFNQGLLLDLLAELSGDVDTDDLTSAACTPAARPGGGGAQLQQIPVPPGMAGRSYGELFMALAAGRGLVCLGLYRRKTENPGTRLSFVVCNPPYSEKLEATDRVFVLRPR